VTPEQHPLADEAARYVLGQLSPQARHEFEVHLAQSAELRAVVQELEAGLEVLTRAVPQRPPPPQLWAPLEQAIAREANRKILRLPTWSGWWRNGWAAAAACLLAFVSYAWWSARQPPPVLPMAEVAPVIGAPPGHESSAQADRPGPDVAVVVEPTNPVTLAARMEAEFAADGQSNTPELLRLRGQVAMLRTQLEELAGIITQQSAIMAEPGRFQFFSLQDDANSGAGNAPPLSAGLQRAIFYAMAQDLGWLPATSSGADAGADPKPAKRTAWGIDFVELQELRNAAKAAESATPAASADAVSLAAANFSVRTSGDIPGYLQRETGRELVLAFDPTIVASGSKLEFWSGSYSGGHQLMGTTLTGDNPMVVTIPASQIQGDLTVTSSADGVVPKVIGQFFILRHPGAETLPALPPITPP
jgi:hypothetical protein